MRVIPVKLKLRKIERRPKPKSGFFANKCDGLFISEAGDISDLYMAELRVKHIM